MRWCTCTNEKVYVHTCICLYRLTFCMQKNGHYFNARKKSDWLFLVTFCMQQKIQVFRVVKKTLSMHMQSYLCTCNRMLRVYTYIV